MSIVSSARAAFSFLSAKARRNDQGKTKLNRKSVQNGTNRRALKNDPASQARFFRTASIIREPLHLNVADVPPSGGREMKKCLG
jgi:hypothetical protein